MTTSRCAGAALAVLGFACFAPCVSAQDALVVGTEDGGTVHGYSGAGNLVHDLQPFGATFTGGVRVAVGDVNSDGDGDLIVAAGPDDLVDTEVLVFDGRSGESLGGFLAYGAGFRGGVAVAAGDVNRDGAADIVIGPGEGSAGAVRVIDGRRGTELHSFFAFDPGFTGGVHVAAGDVDGDRFDDIIVGAGAGGGPHVKVFSGVGLAPLHSFFAYDTAFQGGVRVAAGDWNGDGRADIVTGAGSGAGGGPHVKVFSGVDAQPLASFLAFAPGFTGGVYVASGDVSGDGLSDLIVATGSGVPGEVAHFIAPAITTTGGFFPFGTGFSGGVFVATVVPLPTLFADGFEE